MCRKSHSWGIAEPRQEPRSVWLQTQGFCITYCLSEAQKPILPLTTILRGSGLELIPQILLVADYVFVQLEWALEVTEVTELTKWLAK